MTRDILGAATLALALGATAALAEGFTVYDLGPMPSRDLCMQKAGKILNAYMNQNGGWEVQTTDWIVYGWDFEPGDQDVVVMCPIFGTDAGEIVNAMMVVYGEDTDERRMFTAEEISARWQAR